MTKHVLKDFRNVLETKEAESANAIRNRDAIAIETTPMRSTRSSMPRSATWNWSGSSGHQACFTMCDPQFAASTKRRLGCA